MPTPKFKRLGNGYGCYYAGDLDGTAGNVGIGAGMNKYGARKTHIDGYTFDSVKESRRFQELRLLEWAGEIGGLEVHPRYEILPAHKHPVTGKPVRAIYYEADFRYWILGAGKPKPVVEDVKGVQTAVFRLKRKLVEYKYRIEIVLVE
jgi:hypothetical protein